jgi:hypothetical protein
MLLAQLMERENQAMLSNVQPALERLSRFDPSSLWTFFNDTVWTSEEFVGVLDVQGDATFANAFYEDICAWLRGRTCSSWRFSS